jgi:serine/threonine protein kinase
MSVIEKKDKLGEGAYGIVYAGAIKERNKEVKVAIKRNYGDPENIGISCIREMNFLAFFNHPCITKLKHISIGDPFEKKCPMTPRPKRYDMKEDSHHFVLEYAGQSLEDYYDECTDYYFLKIIMCQILLGIEFIHSKRVIHRDLKPANILVIHEKEDLPYAKICDFGLSCYPSNYRPSTPGAVTSWYRAPEICCEYDDYSYPSDMWSIGCIFYEMLIKKPFIKINKDNSKAIFREIISQLPEKFSTRQVNEFINEGDCGKFKHGYTDILTPGKKPFIDHLSKIDTVAFNKTGGSKRQFSEILDNLLVLQPENRWSAKKCLDHPFFRIFHPFMLDMQTNYPTEKDKTRKLKIVDCIERRWAVNIAIKIYNLRDDLKWYSDHVIFHAIRIFDEYLVLNYNSETNPRKKVTRGIGQLLTEHEVNIYFYTCVYIMYKYFSTLYRIYTWDKIFPKHLAVNKNKKIVEKFEIMILKDVCNYVIFRPTLIEYLDEDYSKRSNTEKDLDIRKYLLNYGDIGCDYEGTMEDLYLQIREGLKETD